MQQQTNINFNSYVHEVTNLQMNAFHSLCIDIFLCYNMASEWGKKIVYANDDGG